MVLAWENLQEVFVMLIVVVVIFAHWRFLISLFIDVIPHPSVSYRRLFTPILYFQPSSLQSNSRRCHFNFSGLFIFTASATVLSGFFVPQAFFTLLSCACDSDVGRNTPSRIFLYVCPHRVVPSGWCMDLNYWCLNYRTIGLSIAPVSHEV